jgi:alkanesulfonate monooxygenase SsuD/methylene tetrahydromethanopterin reductase-like flavin-dependent oxidoreductase (luciferase family)
VSPAGRPWPSFGVLHQGWATGDRSDAAVLAEVVRSTVLAEDLGFDVAWFTEQHAHMSGSCWGRIAAPHLMIAHLAARTDRIALGTAVRLIAGEPVDRVAEELLTLDLLAGGRVQYGIGAGMAGPGSREDRRSAMRAAAGALARILRGEDAHAADRMAVRARDLTGRLHVATTDPRSMALAAGEGFGYLAGMFGGDRHPELVRQFRGLGGRGPVRASRMVYVGDDDRTARSEVEPAARYFWDHFMPPSPGWRKAMELAGPPRDLDDICARLGWVVGGPATVAARLTDYVEGSGLDGLDLSFQVPGLSAGAADRAMAAFAAEVRPDMVRRLESRRSARAGIAQRVPDPNAGTTRSLGRVHPCCIDR